MIKYIYILTMLTVFNGANLFSQSSFSGERLKQACIDYIYDKVGNDAEISISSKIDDQKFTASGVIAKLRGEENSLKGNTNVAIEFLLDDKLVKRVQVPVRIKLWKEVPVAKESIHRGEVITEEDLLLEKKDITNFSNSEIVAFEEILNSKAKRNISESSIITSSFIEKGNMINKGDKVQLVVQTGNIRIQAFGEALQDAGENDMLRVRREGTKTILQGRVASDGTVIISQN